ncbi:MAG: mechanosensitive ion channel [Deltaproteobacteria bacterium]|nr:mechanosensitive ion channel [Deltaproteobacteria bacterium]
MTTDISNRATVLAIRWTLGAMLVWLVIMSPRPAFAGDQVKNLGEGIKRVEYALEKRDEILNKARRELPESKEEIKNWMYRMNRRYDGLILIYRITSRHPTVRTDVFRAIEYFKYHAEDLLLPLQNLTQTFPEDELFISEAIEKIQNFKAEYETTLPESAKPEINNVQQRLLKMNADYAEVSKDIAEQKKIVHDFILNIEQKQTDLNKKFHDALRRNLFHRSPSVVNPKSWGHHLDEVKGWQQGFLFILKELYCYEYVPFSELISAAGSMALVLILACHTILFRLDKRVPEAAIKRRFFNPFIWLSLGLSMAGLILFTRLPSLSIYMTITGILISHGLVKLAWNLRIGAPTASPPAESASVDDSGAEAAPPKSEPPFLQPLWLVCSVGVLLINLAAPQILLVPILIMFLFFAWRAYRQMAGIEPAWEKTIKQVILGLIPVVIALAVFGWGKSAIDLITMFLIICLIWQLSFGIGTALKKLDIIPTEIPAWLCLRHVCQQLGPLVIFAMLFLFFIPIFLIYLGGHRFLHEVMNLKLGMPPVTFDIYHLLWMLAALIITRLATVVTDEGIAFLAVRHPDLEKGAINSLKTIATYLWWFIFGMALLYLIGFSLSNLAVITGGLSVGIGFGLQNIINNFVSGLILLFGRTVQAGDLVEFQEKLCIVKKVSIRTTVLRTYSGKTIFVPNSLVVSKEFSNWSHQDKRIRMKVEVGVAYNSDPKQVTDLLLEIAKSNPKVLDKPKPLVLFEGFGPSSLMFQLKFWIKNPNSLRAGSEIRYEIFRIFTEKGITIPVPQMDLHIRSADGLGKIGLTPNPAEALEESTRETEMGSPVLAV